MYRTEEIISYTRIYIYETRKIKFLKWFVLRDLTPANIAEPLIIEEKAICIWTAIYPPADIPDTVTSDILYLDSPDPASSDKFRGTVRYNKMPWSNII